jgi:hypothetical protein
VSPSKKADRQKEKAAITEATPVQDHKKSGIGVVVLRLLAIAAVIGITVYIYSIRDRVEEFAAWGIGHFPDRIAGKCNCVLSCAGRGSGLCNGSIFNPLGVALAASAGAAIVELSGYLAGSVDSS